jgi:hypothetical protein
LLCTHGSQGLIELQHQNPVHASPRQKRKSFAKISNPWRRFKRAKILSRKRLENDYRGRQSHIIGFTLEMPQDRLVTQMDTVKGTHGNGATPVLLSQIVKTADQFHGIEVDERIKRRSI